MASITPVPSDPVSGPGPRAAWAPGAAATARRPVLRSLPGGLAAPRDPEGAGLRDPHGTGFGDPEGMGLPAHRLLREGQRSGRLIHLEQIAARPGIPARWPDWAPEPVIEAFGRRGVRLPGPTRWPRPTTPGPAAT